MNTLKKTLNDSTQDLTNNGDDPIIWPITVGIVQVEAESEIDRELTDIELNRLRGMFFEDEDVSWRRLVMIREAISEAIDNSKHQWDEVDKDYQEEMLKEVKK